MLPALPHTLGAWLFLVGVEDFPMEAVSPLSPAEGTHLQGVNEDINYGDCLRTKDAAPHDGSRAGVMRTGDMGSMQKVSPLIIVRRLRAKS